MIFSLGRNLSLKNKTGKNYLESYRLEIDIFTFFYEGKCIMNLRIELRILLYILLLKQCHLHVNDSLPTRTLIVMS